ncbi:MAG: glutamate racemase [Chloroflexi bacterium]|nr:glutamate racemase [Chloroflexota bacterium]
MAQRFSRIGVLDSGIGGLSVLRYIHRMLPNHPTLYFADQAHLPYGPRPAAETRAYVTAITRFLLERGAAVIVLACNAASAASLYDLRRQHPDIPFVGMEPAVKPAAAATQTGVIGVLTTRTTANGALYRRTLERHAGRARVLTQIAPELVTIAESGSPNTPENRTIIRRYVEPLVEAGADQIVLACTHFPFLSETIQEIAGTNVTLIDPAPAVARQVARVWPKGLMPSSAPNTYYTSGDPASFQMMLKRLIGVEAHAGYAHPG